MKKQTRTRRVLRADVYTSLTLQYHWFIWVLFRWLAKDLRCEIKLIDADVQRKHWDLFQNSGVILAKWLEILTNVGPSRLIIDSLPWTVINKDGKLVKQDESAVAVAEDLKRCKCSHHLFVFSAENPCLVLMESIDHGDQYVAFFIPLHSKCGLLRNNVTSLTKKKYWHRTLSSSFPRIIVSVLLSLPVSWQIRLSFLDFTCQKKL